MLGAVGHIDNHANTIHLFDHLATKPRDTAILGLITTRRQRALIVVGELHDPHTQLVEYLDHLDIVFNRRAILKTKNNADFTEALRLENIAGAVHSHDKVAVIDKMSVPCAYIFERFTDIFPIGNGHMNRAQATLLCLFKQVTIPVDVL